MAMLIIYWRKRICPWCNNLPWLVLLILLGQAAQAVNQDQLWLPRDYYRHFKKLSSAAEMSEQTERCAYVIAGTLSQERSTKDHPVFVVTCRDKERQTFAYIVDGLSLEILNRPPPADPELLKQQELQLKLEKKWLACFEQLKLRTNGLRGNNLTQDFPTSEMEGESKVSFQVDFNATSKQGQVLHYRALCHYQGDTKRIEIHPLISFKEENKDEASVEPELAETEPQ